MSDTPNPRPPANHPGDGAHEPTREDVLIGRIVDAEASPADWRDLDRIGATDPGVWERLARAQRAHARLERGVEDEIAVSELVELPMAHHHAVFDLAARVRGYGGWAVAAVLALALLGSHANLRTIRPTDGFAAGFTPIEHATPDQAYDRYVSAGRDSGRVIDVMPSVLVDAGGLGSAEGGEVVILRRVLERVDARNMSFYMVEPNEFEQPTLTPVQVRQAERHRTDPAGF